MRDMGAAILAIVGSVIGLAALSVILSPKANTVAVLSTASGGLASLVAAAVNPVTSAGTNGNLGGSSFSMPSSLQSTLGLVL